MGLERGCRSEGNGGNTNEDSQGLKSLGSLMTEKLTDNPQPQGRGSDYIHYMERLRISALPVEGI